jgi:hypothetical protein
MAGSILLYEGRLRFFSSLLLREETPQVPGRDTNQGPGTFTLRQAGALTGELRHTHQIVSLMSLDRTCSIHYRNREKAWVILQVKYFHN